MEAKRLISRLESISGPHLQIAVFLLGLAIVASRRPDAIFNPQFWAEDGKVWYADSYNVGISSLLWPHNGYFCSLPRLTATLAQCVSLCRAPLLFNLSALLWTILPLQLLVSSRLSTVATLSTRLVLGFLYLSLPNTAEIHANLTNSQWYLALLGFMAVISALPRTWGWRCFDLLVIALCSLTGVFVVMLTPLAAKLWWKRREPWRLVVLLTLASGCVAQGLSALSSTLSHAPHFQRPPAHLGATPAFLAKILADQVFLGPVVGRNALCFNHSCCAVVVAGIGTALVAYALLKGPLELKLFVVFGASIFVASLAWPHSLDPAPVWQIMAAGGGTRYFFVPMLGFVATLVWTLRGQAPRALRFFAVLALCLMYFGIVRDWRCPRYADLSFRDYASRFESLPPGTVFTIPLNPPGWAMRLVRH